MGSWQLESIKMFIYVMFPVAAFHIFNQPDIFKEWVTRVREQHYKETPGDHVKKMKEIRFEYQKQMMQKNNPAITS